MQCLRFYAACYTHIFIYRTFIVSIVRIVYYLDYTNEDPSYSFLGTAYSTPAEVCLGVMVASAPTWRSVWTYTAYMARSIFSKVFRDHTSFNWRALHSEARSTTLVSSTHVDSEGRMELEEGLRKSSATRTERDERIAGGQLQIAPVTTLSIAQSWSQSDLAPEPVRMA